jgi:hypothetical protein
MSNIFSPGQAPNTVRAADEKIVTVPDGWVLAPHVDAAVSCHAGRADHTSDHVNREENEEPILNDTSSFTVP